MTEARFSLIIAFASLIVAFLPFYYQYLRARHHLSVAIVKWGYLNSKLSISAAFLNQGNKDEIVLDLKPIVAATKAKSEWRTIIDQPDWMTGVGKDSFLIQAGTVTLKRIEMEIPGSTLPFVEINEPEKGKRTDIGVQVLYLGRDAEVKEKLAYFASLRTVTFPKGLTSGGDATGYVHSRTDPRSFNLLKY